MSLLQRNTPCPECPWLADAEPGKFTTERYRSLASSARQELGCVFACHMSSDASPIACAGYLAVVGPVSLQVRLMAAQGLVDVSAVAVPADVALYPSYRALAVANGVAPDDPCLDGTEERGVRAGG